MILELIFSWSLVIFYLVSGGRLIFSKLKNGLFPHGKPLCPGQNFLMIPISKKENPWRTHYDPLSMVWSWHPRRLEKIMRICTKNGQKLQESLKKIKFFWLALLAILKIERGAKTGFNHPPCPCMVSLITFSDTMIPSCIFCNIMQKWLKEASYRNVYKTTFTRIFILKKVIVITIFDARPPSCSYINASALRRPRTEKFIRRHLFKMKFY